MISAIFPAQTANDCYTVIIYLFALPHAIGLLESIIQPRELSNIVTIAMASEKKPNLGKAIVIGGCGFLGHHVVNLLLERYTSEPSVIDLRCSVNRRPDSDGVNYFEADITDADKMLYIFQKVKPDVVIHTASPAVQATAKVADALFKKVNVDGTRVVVETCQKTGVKALVYTSSASILSNNKDDLINVDERWPVIRGKDQTEYYSETKVCYQGLRLCIHIC